MSVENSKLFAVFGNPVLHSKSPHLFNSIFKDFKQTFFYTRVHPANAGEIARIIRELPLSGANITAPYKELLVTQLDLVSDDVQQIGAVNTIVNQDGTLVGYNTDHCGVIKSIEEAGLNLPKLKCLILGAGGAAKAAVYGLMKSGADVTICNRTLSKAESISNLFDSKVIDWDNVPQNSSFDIVVSALPPIASPEFLNNLNYSYLLDASYKGSITCDISRMKGVKIISGERWLLHQAVEAYRLMIGEEPQIDLMGKGFNIISEKNKLAILHYSDTSFSEIIAKQADMVLQTAMKNNLGFKLMANEEIGKAFGN